MTTNPGVLRHVAAFPPGDMSPFIQSSDMSAHSRAFFDPDIANAFFRSGEIEARGRGIWRIYQACKEAGTPKPILQYEPNDLWLEFRFSNEYRKSISQGESTEAHVTPQETEQVAEQVIRLLRCLTDGPLGGRAAMAKLGLRHQPTFHFDYLQPALDRKLVEMSQPKSPRSPTQKYRLTAEGEATLAARKKENHK